MNQNPTHDIATLPFVRAADLDEESEGEHWLIDDLIPRSGCFFIGGSPKLGKSWIGIDATISVASATPCLGRFPVQASAPCLIYLAEDPQVQVKARLDALCRHRGIALAGLPINVITVPTLRLDRESDQEALTATVRLLKPKLLLLDPFVRMHRINENDSQQVSALLAYLREIQRAYDLALIVVHHARKNGPAGAQAGQGLRGSGDFYAFVDGLLYLRSCHDRLQLTIEHRAAPSPDPIDLKLVTKDPRSPHLEVTSPATSTSTSGAPPKRKGRNLEISLLRVMDKGDARWSRAALRAALHVRNESIGEALADLAAAGHVIRQGDLWSRTRTARPATPLNGNAARNAIPAEP
jgi:hypothetical protein